MLTGVDRSVAEPGSEGPVTLPASREASGCGGAVGAAREGVSSTPARFIKSKRAKRMPGEEVEDGFFI